MSKPIKITESEWEKILTQIKNEHPPSVCLIRSKMKNVLGFTPRDTTEFDISSYGRYVYLDFYCDKKKTAFILKYGAKSE